VTARAGASQDADDPLAAHLAGRLARRLRGEVRGDSYTRSLYSSDASMYAIPPLVVALPRDEADVVAALEVARTEGVPVLPRGAGTSLAGQTVNRAIVLDFSRHMSRILDLDPVGRRAVVQPGVVQDQLNRSGAPTGLMFGPDTSTSDRATIGGMVGNNSAGSHSVRYGSTVDHVDALRVVLADATVARLVPLARDADGSELGSASAGAIFRGVRSVLDRNRDALATYPPFWRHSGGYRLERAMAGGKLDLAKLVVGSEGTLAVVTEATVRMVPKPAAVSIAVGHFGSVAEAVAATSDALELEPASVEMMDETILRLSRQRLDDAHLAPLLSGEPAALVFVEFFGDSTSEVDDKADALARAWAAHGHGHHTLRATDRRTQEAVQKLRKASLGLLMAASSGTRRPLAFVEDTAVPPPVLEGYVRELAAILERNGLEAGFYGHCSVGCLHVRPFVDLRAPGQAEVMRAVAEEVAGLAARYGGVNSSEHGDGLVRSEFNPQLFGPGLYHAMCEIKELFDPGRLLNPGKIVDAPAMTAHLREHPGQRTAVDLPTRLSFRGEGGLLMAAERCMNIGACRKDRTGVMCPSYMATREEEHSTRGRANALAKALSEPDPGAALADPRLHEILDLCLECKACKSECPLGVDVAALKSEALHQRHLRQGVPLRSRAFAEVRVLSRLGAAAAPVTNRLAEDPRLRVLLERFAGISRARPLPRLHRPKPLGPASLRPAGRPPRGEAVLLTDSFTTYGEPQLLRAAAELLSAAGLEVVPSGTACCGRAAISKGLLERAGTLAAAMVERLAPFVARGVPVVGVEPSCLLTFKDEYLRLRPDDDRAHRLARQAVLLPEFLLAEFRAGRLTFRPDAPLRGARIVFHGHCHEQALVGTAPTLELLQLVPGAAVEQLDAGCCGMAGSFGYEAEHYELSMQIGSDRLFPALLAEPEATLVAATGTSCRQQIAHGTGRRAVHPIEIVREAAALAPAT
jgi:FAD/FMN-containing dehydrogenase/Fe-S oxidoreductase